MLHVQVGQLTSSPQSPEGSLFSLFLPFILFFFIYLVFYFLVFRPQHKKEKERKRMLDSLKKGDEVVTAGGIYGKVEQIAENEVILRVAPNLCLEFSKTSILCLRTSKKKKGK